MGARALVGPMGGSRVLGALGWCWGGGVGVVLGWCWGGVGPRACRLLRQPNHPGLNGLLCHGHS